MNHNQLKEKLLKAMGGRVPMEARTTWGEFLRSKGTTFFLNYDWIKVPAFYKWCDTYPDVDFGDSANGLTVWIENN